MEDIKEGDMVVVKAMVVGKYEDGGVKYLRLGKLNTDLTILVPEHWVAFFTAEAPEETGSTKTKGTTE